MGAIDHLGAGHEMAALVRRIERLERAAPIGFSSVSRGALRITSDEGLIVEGSARVSGQLIVTGTETVDGTLRVTGETFLDGESEVNGNMDVNGTMNVDGPLGVNGLTYLRGATEITGETTVNGGLDINGTTNIDGPLGVNGEAFLRGNTEVTGDLTVMSDGKIAVGNMRIGEGTHGSGKGVSFTNGSALSAIGDGIQVYASSAGLLSLGTAESKLSHAGYGITANWDGVKLAGLALNTSLTPNVHIDAQGRLWRTS